MSVANSGGSPNKSVVDTGQVKIVKKSVERAQVRPDWTNYVSSQINNPTMCSVCIQRHCFKVNFNFLFLLLLLSYLIF